MHWLSYTKEDRDIVFQQGTDTASTARGPKNYTHTIPYNSYTGQNSLDCAVFGLDDLCIPFLQANVQSVVVYMQAGKVFVGIHSAGVNI